MNDTETGTTVTIEECVETPYRHYDRQTEPQEVYLELDVQTGKLIYDYDSEIGNAVPFTVYHGFERRYYIPLVTAATANELMTEIAPLAQRIVNGFEEVWNGNNLVAKLDRDARAADEEIEARLEGIEGDFHVWQADEWLAPVTSEVKDELRGGKTVDQLYDEYQGEGNDEDSPYVEGLHEYLESLAEEIVTETEN